VHRLHRSLESAVREGFPRLLRIGPGCFEWDGGRLVTRDEALEAFRFQLQIRQITELAVEPGAEAWELRELLACLNLGESEIDAGGGLGHLLRERQVVHIAVRGPLWGDEGGRADRPGSRLLMGPPGVLDGVVAALLEALAREFRTLTDDRRRLAGWLASLAPAQDHAAAAFEAIRMLIPMIQAEPDRELRYRVLGEAIMALAEPLLGALASEWLLPRARTEPELLDLLARLSADELASLVARVPEGALERLRTDLERLPGDDWRTARLRSVLAESRVPPTARAQPLEPLIPDDDPEILRFRETARAACLPGEVLSHSVGILFRLLATADTERYPIFVVDALEEAAGEALARDNLPLALEILRSLGQAGETHPEWLAEHQQRFHFLQRRLSGRTHVSLLTDLVGRSGGTGEARDAAEYLLLLGRDAIEEFIVILAEKQDGRVRLQMLDVLAAVGPPAVPAIRPWVTDSRWFMARNMVVLLTRIGDETAFQAVEKVARHDHAQVRREVVRALAALGRERAAPSLREYLKDADPEVRLTAIRLLGGLMTAGDVSPLREFLTTPTRTVTDLLVKREIITTLYSIGTAEARDLLRLVAERRIWPWQRNELKVRALAEETLRALARPAPASPGHV